MNKFNFFLALCSFSAALFSQPVRSMATLIDVNNTWGHIIYDDTTGKDWIWDLSAFTSQTFAEQHATVTTLNQFQYAGIDTWHMATLKEVSSLWESAGGIINYEFPGATNAPGLMIFGPSIIYTDYTAWYGRTGDGPPRIIGTNNDLANHPVPAYTPPDPIYDWDATAERPAEIGAWVASDPTTPTPEPATLLLLGTGLAGLAGARIRKRKK